MYPRTLRWIIGAIGLAASAGIWWYAHTVEARIAQSRFDADAHVRVEAVERELLAVNTAIIDGAGFLTVIEGNISDHFYGIAQPLLDREATLQALSWNPIVRHEDREVYENRIREEGNPDFEITERRPSGALSSAAVAPEYVAVEIIVPQPGNESAVGYNVASESRRRAALETARISGKVSATAPITLVQETANQSGVLVFAPVYRGTDTVIGYVVAVLRMGDAISMALEGFQLGSMGVLVQDSEAPSGDRVLFSSGIEPISGVDPFSTEIEYAGRRWSVEMQPGHQYSPRSLQPNLLALGAAAFVLLYLAWAGVANRRNRELREVIEQRESAYAARARSEERFRIMVDSISDGGWEISLPTDSIVVSDGWLVGLGHEKHDAPRNLKDWAALIHPDDRDRAAINAADYLEGDGALYDSTIRLRHRDGSYLWYRRRARAIDWDSTGHPKRIVGIDVNVTAERQQRELQKRLERNVYDSQKLESLVGLAGGVAHDFNNMLVGVLGAAELALSQNPGKDLVLQLERIRESAIRAVDLTRQMLTYAGRAETEFEPADSVEIIRGMRKVLESSIGNSQALHFELAEDAGAVLCNPTQIRQLILNLVVNASEAMKDVTGSILVQLKAVTLTADDIIEIGSLSDLQPGTYVRLDVADEGVGFATEIKERAFDPFFSTKDTGRGLGLASVLGIVRRHGGEIKVCSRERGGTIMRVWLPRSDADLANSVVEQPVEERETTDNSAAVLVIDDEESVRKFLESALTMTGYTVFNAASGAEGIELYDQHAESISLVLLDSNMPGMSGLQTYNELKKRDTVLPVILMSGFPPNHLEFQQDIGGLAGFIQKPFRLNELYRRVQDVICS